MNFVIRIRCLIINDSSHIGRTADGILNDSVDTLVSNIFGYKFMWLQKEFSLKPRRRGFHLITDEILQSAMEIRNVKIGLINILIKHTSASITINENADPTVRQDFESFFNNCVPENEPYYLHKFEGSDDLPAHIKSSILGCSLNLPITNGCLNLGTWQGIYLCEHRNHGGSRTMVVTVQGEYF